MDKLDKFLNRKMANLTNKDKTLAFFAIGPLPRPNYANLSQSCVIITLITFPALTSIRVKFRFGYLCDLTETSTSTTELESGDGSNG